MTRIFKPAITLLLALVFCQSLLAQDSTGGVKGWSVEAKKIAEGKYELTFLATVAGDWQVYAPMQQIPGLFTTSIAFNDSAITQEGDFIVNPPVKVTGELFDNSLINIYRGDISWKAIIKINGQTPATLRGQLKYTYGKKTEFYPATSFAFSVKLEGGVETTSRIKIPAIDIKNPATNCGDEGTAGKSILTIFLLGLLYGLIALITPCVFPMIPVTVTFFTKKAQTRKKGIAQAALYGFFIFLIYILITIPFHIASNTRPEIFNNISTNVTLNIIFFIIFVVFALSFFGLFEIGLPSGLANKAGSKSGIGTIAGIFFMAATLTIVSFSCTGPILGTLLANVSDGGTAWPLTAGAAGFGIALGLPFALFAMFPNWLQSLPKSGGWMDEVKVVLGFIELALAVKFISNADLVKQWGLLKRELFIALWILIGLCIVVYLLTRFRKRAKMGARRFSPLLIFFTVLFLSITIYLIPGLTNTKAANLKLISGFPPPLCYSLYDNPVNCKTGFKPLEDYETALAQAKKEHKPLLIDFTGWACVNCRKMEESVWTDPLVDSLMHTQFVVVSLYVDERRKLPASEQTLFKTSSGAEKEIITVGDKWATFQTENFGATSQPQYAIISPDEKALTKNKYYNPSARSFSDWLECGLGAFKTGGK